MNDIRAGLVAFLAVQIPTLTGRIHPSVLPDKATLPAVVYRVVSDRGDFAHDAVINLRNPRIQLDVWARRQSDAADLSRDLETALLGYRGPMGGLDYTAGWGLEDSTDLFEDETRLYRVSMDFRGWYAPQEAT